MSSSSVPIGDERRPAIKSAGMRGAATTRLGPLPWQGGVRDVLAATGLFSERAVDCAEVVPVTGGLTNHSYRITVGTERYVLRMPGAGTGAHIDRKQEAHNARAAARIGIAPEVLHANPRTGIALVRCIDGGRALDEAAFRDPATLDGAVELLARLHRSGAHFRGEMVLFPRLDQYCRLCERRRPDLLAPLEGLRHRARGLREWLEGTREPRRPCHIDPAPSNFMRSADSPPRLYLLDWEFSARCEPAWDLADFSAEAALSEAQDRHLLCCYYGTAGPEREDRFLAYKGLLHLLAATWAALRVAHGDEEPGVRRLIEKRAAESERVLDLAGAPPLPRTLSRSP